MIKYLHFSFFFFVIARVGLAHFLPFSIIGNSELISLKVSNETNSGLAAAISNNFYENFTTQLLDDLAIILKETHIPDFHYEQTLLFMDFVFQINNITISNIDFDISQFNLLFENDNSTSANIVINDLFLNFSYIFQYCLIDIEDVGYIDVKGLTLDLDFGILKNNSGVELDLNSLIIDYSTLSLNLGECFDKQILAFLTKSTINLLWPLIKTSISSSLKTIIDENLNEFSQDIPSSIAIPNTDVNLDISLVSNPYVLESFYIINLNGDFYKRDTTPEILKPAVPFEVNLTENVSQIFFHAASINSLFKHIFETHVLNYTIYGNITDGVSNGQFQLDSRSLNDILPGLKGIPNQPVVFQIENQIDYQPIISFIEGDDNSKSHINLLANLSVSLYLGEFTPENYYLSLNVSFAANFKILRVKQGFLLKVNDIILTNVETSPLDDDKVNKQALYRDGNTFINLGISFLNKELYKKILKLPSFMSLQLECNSLTIKDSYITADIKFSSDFKSYFEKKRIKRQFN